MLTTCERAGATHCAVTSKSTERDRVPYQTCMDVLEWVQPNSAPDDVTNLTAPQGTSARSDRHPQNKHQW